ncbi:MAG TPA: hypothetical protein VFQ27_00075 [Xanthobacteraceae bacterium]|nr:hypothetical protein [Xanthobacteraceae bacterium]
MFHSVLIGDAGKPCYGQIFTVLGGRRRGGTNYPSVALGGAVTEIEVVRRPRQGRFEMIGHRDFRYVPAANMRGWDKIVLRYVVHGRGGPRMGRVVFHATTREIYLSGEASPPQRGPMRRGWGPGR